MKSLGRFGKFGGCYVTELLLPALAAVEEAFLACRDDPGFNRELDCLLREFAGRPTPITEMKRLGRQWGCTLVLKREDLLHGGAHKTNNVLGQALLAARMGRTELIAETGAGQHGVATAMAGALFGLPVKIFMGAKDVKRQHPNVQRMRLFGAEVVEITAGSQTLKDAINEALRIGPRTAARHIMSSARSPGRIHFPAWWPISRASSARKPGPSAWINTAGFPTPSALAWAAGATPSARFGRFSTTAT